MPTTNERVVIPPAEREMTHTEMQEHYQAEDPVSRRRQIIRTATGRWRSGNAANATYTHDRNEAYVYSCHGATPTAEPGDSIIEILPDEPAGGTPAIPPGRYPPPIEERDRAQMQVEYWRDGCNQSAERPWNRQLLIRLPNGMWADTLSARCNGTPDRNNAHLFDGYARTPASAYPAGTVAELLPFPGEVAGAPKAKSVHNIFTPDFIQLMKTAPKNEMVRGWLLKKCRVMPPEDCDTFEKIEAWVASLEPAKVETLKANKGIEIPMSFSRKETGICKYRETSSASGRFVIKPDELAEMVRDAVEEDIGIDDLYENYIRELIANEVWERITPNWESDGDIEYDAYDGNGDSEDDYDYTAADVISNLKDWIRKNMPEAVEPLGL